MEEIEETWWVYESGVRTIELAKQPRDRRYTEPPKDIQPTNARVSKPVSNLLVACFEGYNTPKLDESIVSA